MTVDPNVRIARRRAMRQTWMALLRDTARVLDERADEAEALACRCREAARQKRLTADQLAAHQLDITDIRRDPA